MTPGNTRSSATACASIGAICSLAVIVFVEGLGTDAPAPAVIGLSALLGLSIGALAHVGLARPLNDLLSAERSGRRWIENELTIGRQRRGFVEQLDAAIEMADTEAEVLGIIARSLAVLMGERENSLLLTAAEEPRVIWSIEADAAGLGEARPLGSPERCSALTLGRPVYSDSSSGLDACPHLGTETLGGLEVSSVCLPIRCGESHLAVAHSSGPAGELPDDETRRLLDLVARRAGSRVTALRAARDHGDHVALDPLTGLPNHTVVHGRLRELMGGTTQFALAFCDLDAFSDYNDRNGSEAGDTALRLYAEVLEATLRPTDIAARYAGDRFLCLFPNCSAEHAASAMERVRESLVLELSIHELDPFTVSIGVVDSEDGVCVEDLLETADVTLSVAKHSGGNRVSKAKFNSVEN